MSKMPDKMKIKQYFLEVVLHSIRVTYNAVKIAKRRKLSRRDKKDLFLACLLHDIGKFQIDSNILFKKEELTDEEYMEIKKHQILSYTIIKKFYKNEQVLRLVKNHNNKISVGNELLSILQFADMNDALKYPRSYRKKEVRKEERIELLSRKFPQKFLKEVAQYV